MFDRTPSAQIPVLGRAEDCLIVAYFLNRDCDQALRRPIKWIRQNPTKPVKLLLEPLLEPHFSRFSFASRPNRSAHHALAFVRSAIRAGKSWAVTADIPIFVDILWSRTHLR